MNDAGRETLNVAVRVESGPQTGYGHVRRTLAVLEALADLTPVSACYYMSPAADGRMIEAAGHAVRRIRGCSPADWAAAMAGSATVAMLDTPDPDPALLSALAEAGLCTVLFTDGARLPACPVDVIINAAPGAERLDDPAAPAARRCLGPQYFALRKELQALRSGGGTIAGQGVVTEATRAAAGPGTMIGALPDAGAETEAAPEPGTGTKVRSPTGADAEASAVTRLATAAETATRLPMGAAATAQRVLVTFGGSDPEDCTARLAEALVRQSPTWRTCFVLGPGYDGCCEAIVRTRLENVEVHRAPPCFADLLAGADLAVSAAGTTALELAAVGVPAVLISLNAPQHAIGRHLADAGAAMYLGAHEHVLPDATWRAVSMLARDAGRRSALRSAGQTLIDGGGARRAAAAVLEAYLARHACTAASTKSNPSNSYAEAEAHIAGSR